MLDIVTLKAAGFIVATLGGMHWGPKIIGWATNSKTQGATAPQERAVRASNVVDGEVSAKLARRAKAHGSQSAQVVRATEGHHASPEHCDYSSELVDQEMHAGTVE